jgi:hypothetical protein
MMLWITPPIVWMTSRIIAKNAVTVWETDRIAALTTDKTNDRIPSTGRKTASMTGKIAVRVRGIVKQAIRMR